MLAAFIGPLFVRIAVCWYLAYSVGLGLLGIWLEVPPTGSSALSGSFRLPAR